jgi:sec-independent protein translocase protein TatA
MFLPPLALFNLGPWEITIILVIVLILFGGKRLPSLAKDLGTGIKEFKKSLTSAATDEEEKQNIEEDTTPKNTKQNKKS